MKTKSSLLILAIISSLFLLDPHHAHACAPPVEGIISWWQGEGDAHDVLGTNNGAVVGSVGFAPGIVCQAFSFDGQSGYIQVPDSPSLNFSPTSAVTVELWAYCTGTASVMSFMGKRDPNCGATWEYQMAFDPNNGLHFNCSGASGYTGGVYTGLQMPTNVWMHLAATFDGSTFSFYTNGVLAATGSGALGPTNDAPLEIGSSGGCPYFDGLIDEVAIYNRALSAAEIAAIYNGGVPDRCWLEPDFLSQPANLTVSEGNDAFFGISVLGTSPLEYGWYYNSNLIASATNSFLLITNVQMSQAGYYLATASNNLAWFATSNALLSVNIPRAVAPDPSILSWWKAETNALDVYGTNNGSANGTVNYGSGKVGQAFRFDGQSGYIQVPNSPSLNFSPTSSISVEFWAYRTGTASVMCLMGKRDPNCGATWEYQMAFDPNNGLHFNCSGASGYTGGVYTRLQMPTNDWMHLAATFDGSTFSFYTNGVLAAIGTGTLGPTNNATLDIGSSGGCAYFNGLIDEVAIYNRALTASEIQAVYNASIAGRFIDMNRNGLPDSWEMQYFGNLNQTTNGDYDGDGISNLQEYLNGTDPTDYYNGVLPTLVITSGNNQTGQTNTLLPEPVVVNVSSNNVILTNAPIVFAVTHGGALVSATTNGVFNNSLPIRTDASGYATVFVLMPGNAGTNLIQASATSGTNSTHVTFSEITCAPAPANIISWWQAEGDPHDAYGTNSGALFGGASFTNGVAGEAFGFDGSSGFVEVPDSPSLRLSSQITIETWINTLRTNSSQNDQSILSKVGGANGNNGYQLVLTGNSIAAQFNSAGQNWPGYQLFAHGVISPGVWTHVAWTYDQSMTKIYINGQLTASNSIGAHAIVTNSTSVRISNDHGNRTYFDGFIDETAIYNRALSAAEIASIYNNGYPSRCGVPPAFLTQPTNMIVGQGLDLFLQPAYQGSSPLSFQWYFNGNAIAGATQAVLALTNIAMAQGGNYMLGVANYAGSAFTSNALISVARAVPVVAPANIISWWEAESNANDAFGINNGSVSGTVNYAPGIAGHAFSFDGQSGYIQVPDSPSLNFGPTSPMSVELWAYRVGTSNVMHLMGKRMAGCGTFEYQMVFDPVNGLQFVCSEPGAYTGAVYTGLQMPLNVWMHLAATFDGSTFRFYTNGVLAATGSGTLGPTNNAPLEIGSSGGCPYFDGLIDEVAIYSRALSASEIQGIYAAADRGKFIDSNNDGMADNWEMQYFGTLNVNPTGDADGDGLNNLQEFLVGTDPTNPDTDYDGRNDGQEIIDGTDPLNPNSVVAVQLANWSFDNTNTWVGAQGQLPLLASNVVGVAGTSNSAVLVASTNGAVLIYADRETNALANANLQQGAICFGFQPTWTSTTLLGTGPGADARLIEMGTLTSNYTAGWWAICVNSNGNLLSFITASGGNVTTNLAYPVAWLSNDWQHLAINYSRTSSQLYVNGLLAVTNGLGVALFPTASERAASGLKIGADGSGNHRAMGAFDEFRTFNYNLSAAQVTSIIGVGGGAICYYEFVGFTLPTLTVSVCSPEPSLAGDPVSFTGQYAYVTVTPGTYTYEYINPITGRTCLTRIINWGLASVGINWSVTSGSPASGSIANVSLLPNLTGNYSFSFTGVDSGFATILASGVAALPSPIGTGGGAPTLAFPGGISVLITGSIGVRYAVLPAQRLAYWGFNGLWNGNGGQLPVVQSSVALAASSPFGQGVLFNTSTANLQYPAFGNDGLSTFPQASGTPNIGRNKGTVRFWYSPYQWSSSATPASGGTFLNMLGADWRLRFDPDTNPNDPGQTAIELYSNGGQRLCWVSVNWTAGSWHQIAVTYSDSPGDHTVLYVDGAVPLGTTGQPQQSATGPPIQPTACSYSGNYNGNFSLGSDGGSGYVQGIIDQLETFNNPLPAAQISTDYTTAKNLDSDQDQPNGDSNITDFLNGFNPFNPLYPSEWQPATSSNPTIQLMQPIYAVPQ
jgi:Concanavalin A-like lectin/glucanases superfamily/Bacterial TSP3 repeat